MPLTSLTHIQALDYASGKGRRTAIREMEKKKILVVDDEENITVMIKNRLEYSGDYEVKTLSDARDIIRQVHSFRPDVILLDLLMPDIGGLEVCRMLNDDPLGCVTPVIVVSALSKDVDKLKAYRLGIVDYLVKPFDSKVLMIAVEKALRAKQPPSA